MAWLEGEIVIALLALLLLAPPAVRPMPVTPGLTRPLSRAAVCATKWGRDRRHVTEAMKRRVFAAYGIPLSQRSRFEVDHLIPRELGGADDERNLWPQPYTGALNAHMKDRLENALHRQVCAGTLTLEHAQQAIRIDWVAAFGRYVR